jgi:hypothetical protein
MTAQLLGSAATSTCGRDHDFGPVSVSRSSRRIGRGLNGDCITSALTRESA